MEKKKELEKSTKEGVEEAEKETTVCICTP